MLARSAALALLVLSCAGFITRRGTQLFDESGALFRFAGANLYWLGLDENEGGVHYPTHYRIRDGLETIAGVGARLVRGHTLGISSGNPLSFEPALGVFNSSALDAADFAISVAAELGLRLIIPFTDNWHYFHGGKHDFTDWLKLNESAFYTDERAIGAFEAYIAARLAHVNPYTGNAAREEPAIAMWETGNELSAPAAWTERIAAFVKGPCGAQQLVLDGNDGVDASHALSHVDVLSDHFYPLDIARLRTGAATAAAAGRPYIAGEYGWTLGDAAGFLAAVAGDSNVSGANFWSLFPHDDFGGWVNHSDGFTVNYEVTHGAEWGFLQTFAAHAAALAGLPAPPSPPPPRAPTILSADGGSLIWRGAALAAYYDVRVSPANAGGPWISLCPCAAGCDALCISDADVPVALNASLAAPGAWLMLGSFGAQGETGAWSEPFQVPAAM